MAPKTTSPAYTYPYPYQPFFDAVIAVAPSIRFTVQGADPASGAIWARSPMTFTRWGERITIQLWQSQPGFTGISVTSELSFGLADPWGFNRRNIDRFFAALTPYVDTYLAHLRTPEPPAGG